MNFEIIIGVEVHCELKTKSKMFSGAPVSATAPVNACANEIDMSFPGTLPSLNKMGVELSIRACHALNMDIDTLIRFDRKNYFYPDLPKGYQITQDQFPIGRNGYIDIEVDGVNKRVFLERLHMEEDTAKQIHRENYTLLDYNRCGIGLAEIVTTPCMHSAADAVAYLEGLRAILLYTDVSDVKMEEGSMRCDINLSLRPYGSDRYGTRVEIKNLNSLNNVQKAIEFEVARQTKLLLSGEAILAETRRYDETLKQTVAMRMKGDVNYKYVTEMNIVPIRIQQEWVEQIKLALPLLPRQRKQKYIEQYQLSEYDCDVLLVSKLVSDFFEETLKYTSHAKALVNWMTSELFAYLNKHQLTLESVKLDPAQLAQLINEIEVGNISSKQAKSAFVYLIEDTLSLDEIVEKYDMRQISDPVVINAVIETVLAENQQSIADYHDGKDRALGFLIGQVIKQGRGKFNPKMTNDLLLAALVQK